MDKTKRYDFEGVSLEIPLHYDPRAHMYLEEYPDFVQTPLYTPAGCPVLFSGEDACSLAQPAPGAGLPGLRLLPVLPSCRPPHLAGGVRP